MRDLVGPEHQDHADHSFQESGGSGVAPVAVLHARVVDEGVQHLGAPGAQVPAGVGHEAVVGEGERAAAHPGAHGGGIAVDERLRTSDPDIHAAGDVASFPHALFGTRLRVEHWANALNGGPAAARAMLGKEVLYDRVPYFFSDMGRLHMILRGKADDVSQTTMVGDVASKEFVELYPGEEGELKMAIAISGSGDDKRLDALAEKFEKMIEQKMPVAQIGEGALAV